MQQKLGRGNVGVAWAERDAAHQPRAAPQQGLLKMLGSGNVMVGQPALSDTVVNASGAKTNPRGVAPS